MSSYVERYGKREKLETEADYQRELARVNHLLAQGDLLLGALGFSRGYYAGYPVFHHRGLRKCQCGRAPIVAHQVLDDRRWLVQCSECSICTEAHEKPAEAIRDWNAGRFTEISVKLQEPLRAVDVDKGGMMALAGAVVHDALEEYRAAGGKGRKDLERFFEESPLMMGADPDAVREAAFPPAQRPEAE